MRYFRQPIKMTKLQNKKMTEMRYFRRPINFYGPIPSPPGGNQGFYNSVKADAGGYKTQNKTLCYLIGTF